MRQAKITAPRPPPRLVDRPDVRKILDDDAEPVELGRVVLVSAPAGHGKTVAIADWCDATPELPTAWVTLDPSDRDEAPWWSSVLAALGASTAVPADNPLRRLRPSWTATTSSTVRSAFVSAALDALDAIPGRLRLVLDDVHEIVGHPALDGLRELLRHPMPRLTIVLGTRVDPPVGLDRLLLQGRLGQLRVDRLVFSTCEAVALFREEGLPLDDDQVATLVDRTEGWAAALRLAALSVRQAGDPARFVAEFAGDDRSVADYLFGEVWDALPPSDREVLQVASVTSPLPVELAAVLAGRDDVGAALERLEATSGMVAPTDRHREHYRLHELMRSHIRARLRRHRPEHLAELYRRAATWYDARGQHLEALHCASEAHDVAVTRTLLRARAVELMACGEFAVLERSEELTHAGDDPHVGLLLGLAALERGDVELGRARISAAEQELRDDTSTTLGVFRRVVAVRLLDADGDTAHEVAESLAPELAEGRPLRAVAYLTRATGLVTASPDRTLADLDRAREEIGEHDWPYLCVQVESTAALAHMVAGRHRESARHAQAAITEATARGWGGTSWLLRAREALALAQVMAGPPADAGEFPLVLAAVECDTGAPLHGWRRLRHERLVGAPRPPFRIALAAVLEHEAALQVGRVHEAAEVVRATRDRLPGSAETLLLEARQEWAVRQDPARVRALLAPLLAGEVPALTAIGALEPLVLDAEVALARDENSTAHHRLTCAFALADRLGAQRPLLAMAPSLRAFVAAQHESFPGHREVIDRVLATASAESVRLLTERERAVLERLPTMRSASEIADDLAVSINTVKTHQRAIYHKLGVDNRREAVTRARQVGLLESAER
ncbi:LuxR family maltose regulon positive regulatory protein [Actinomycetospora succinea]|uniref:LuxR family maltose regulon positive regulatory protein n=1 Tax=Actinomycetospora succinea TaxID=663603 RepID=A0A4R6UHP2_9PSEU|nr:LuxR C-terminal-related transcriptional regulator [Actinomycetospora succinea]TDQ46391.1 LuxR family maltose regulon positive regulatory protein [Actinomycetospora succinea]